MIVAGDRVRGEVVGGRAVAGALVGPPDGEVVPVTPGVITLRRTLGAVTLSSTVSAVGQVSATVATTLGAATLSSTVTAETPPPPTGETVRATMPAATWSLDDADFRAGEGGSNYFGAFVAIVGDGIDDHAWYFTHDGYGWDPQPYNASLAGFTMHAVNLGAGAQTNTAVATALRAAIDAAAIYDDVAGTGANVEVTGSIVAASCFTGSSTPGTSASWGSHEDVPVFDGNPLSVASQAYSLFTDGPAIATGLGVRLASAGDPVRMALYTGGTAASGSGGTIVVAAADWDGTALHCESEIGGSGTGWVWQPLTPDQVAELADNTPVQYVVKGETVDTHGSFTTAPDIGELNNQQLATIESTDIDPDPSVAFPSSLDAITDLAGSFGVVWMVAFEYRQSPHRGDAGGITITAL